MRQKWGEVARNFVPRPFGTACRRRSLWSPNSLREFKSHTSHFFINKKNSLKGVFLFMADGVRFELTNSVKSRRFSRPVHSTALPPIRNVCIL